jgi:hypothetical protein
VQRGGTEVPWGRLYRLGIEGEGGFPAGMAINGRGLDGELRGGLRRVTADRRGGMKGELHCGLDCDV